MQIERHEIRVFSAVVEEGTFSRAAERLNVSQSAVSQTMANLGHKLDAVLIEGLEISRLPRQVGLHHNKHKALSEGAKRFIAICQARFNGA